MPSAFLPAYLAPQGVRVQGLHRLRIEELKQNSYPKYFQVCPAALPLFWKKAVSAVRIRRVLL